MISPTHWQKPDITPTSKMSDNTMTEDMQVSAHCYNEALYLKVPNGGDQCPKQFLLLLPITLNNICFNPTQCQHPQQLTPISNEMSSPGLCTNNME